MDRLLLNSIPVVFTTGAFLQPIKLLSDGQEKWMWVVTEFVDDTFKDGEVYNPNEFVATKEELLIDTTAEMLES